MKSSPYWQIPVGEWKGETVHVIGGGESLKEFNPEDVAGQRVIAVNNAGLDLVPSCDILFYSDDRWLLWNIARLKRRRGLIVTRNRPSLRDRDLDIKLLRYHGCIDKGKPGLSTDPKYIGGQCGGSTAINMAYLMGGMQIVLWGFDMKPGHYHADHKTTPEEKKAADASYPDYIATLERMAKSLAAEGVHVLNMNPDSALTCFAKAA